MFSKKDILAALDPYAPPPLLAPSPVQLEVLPDFLKQQLPEFGVAAQQCAARPTPALPFAALQQYKEEGEAYREAYAARRQRLAQLALAQWLWPQAGFLPVLQQTLWDICSEPFWCLPYPIDADGNVLLLAEWATWLDEQACETAFLLAECLEMNREALGELMAAQVEQKVRERVLEPFAFDGAFAFEQRAEAGSVVCAALVGATALYLAPEPIGLPNTMERVLHTVQQWMDGHDDDGVCLAGLQTWAQGFGCFVVFAELLGRRTSGRMDLMLQPKVQAMVTAQGALWPRNDALGKWRLGLGCFLQRRYAGLGLPPLSWAAPVGSGPLYFSLRDILWFCEEAQFDSLSSESVWFAQAGCLVSHGSGFSVVTRGKGSYACGSLGVQKGDVALLCDPPPPANWAPVSERVGALRAHNVAMVGGKPQVLPCDAELSFEVTVEPQGDAFGCQLAPCYGDEGLQSYVRTVAHAKKDEFVRLRDEFEFAEKGAVCEVFASPYPFVVMDGAVRLGPEEMPARMSYDPVLFEPHALTETYHASDGSVHVVNLLHLRSRVPAARIVFETELR